MLHPTLIALFAATALSSTFASHAQTPAHVAKDSAVAGRVTDVSTTAVGLLMGASEANPLGLATLGLKYLVYQRIEKAPAEEQPRLWQQYGAFGWGAAANNLCILIAIGTGGAGGAVCPLLGLGIGATLLAQQPPLSHVELERRAFMEYCQVARYRQPELQCIYVPQRV